MSNDTGSTGVKRRDFLKVLGASGAAVATVGCSSENVGNLVPYLVHPDETVAGVSTYYATTCRECAASCGIIAETRDGRITKLEGNPEHPMNRGALCARGQSARAGAVQSRPASRPDGQGGRCVEADRLGRGAHARQPAAWRGAESRRRRQRDLPQSARDGKLPGLPRHVARRLRHARRTSASTSRRTARSSRPTAPRTASPGLGSRSQDARLIVSFGADFLDNWGMSVPQQLDFADARAKIEGAPRFIYVGPRRSLTGLNADQWIACRPGSELAIANALAGRGTLAARGAGQRCRGGRRSRASQQELAAARPALVLAGARGPDALGARAGGRRAQPGQRRRRHHDAARRADERRSTAPRGSADVLAAVERMRAGQVPIAFVRGANPAYSLPAGAQFADAFAKVPFKVSFSLYPDETTELCDLILPDLHSLESWGDAQAVRTRSRCSSRRWIPCSTGTRATADVLIQLAQKDPATAARYPQADYRNWLIASFPWWHGRVHRDAARGASAPGPSRRARSPRPRRRSPPAPRSRSTRRAATSISSPITRRCSATAAARTSRGCRSFPIPSPRCCGARGWRSIRRRRRALGIERGDIVEVGTPSGKVRAPAYLYLGIRPDTIALAIGQGHASAARLDAFEPKNHDVGNIQWGYGRYARGIGVRAHDLLLPQNGSRRRARARRRPRRRSRRPASTRRSSRTEGSARQHGRGIAQALTVTQLGGLRQAPGAEQADAIAPQGSANQESGTGGSQGRNRARGRRPTGATAAPAHNHTRGPTPADTASSPARRGTSSIPDFGLRSPRTRRASLARRLRRTRGRTRGCTTPNHWSGMANRRWAMTIDLARCTGCSACVTACYAENNIPTVGAAWQNATVYAVSKPGFNITRGREMNWLRIERYFEGAEHGAVHARTSRRASSRCSASTAATRRASRCARCTRRTTRPTG